MSNITVSNGQTSTAIAGNEYTVQSGGTLDVGGVSISGDTVSSGGTVSVTSGGAVSSDTVSGILVITGTNATNATANSETIDAGGVIDLFSGTASNTSVSGGRMVISGGNTATNVTVANGGVLELATAKSTVSGSLTMGAGSNALVLDKILSNGNVASVTISGFAAGDAVEIAGGFTSDTLSYATSANNTSVTFAASGSANHQTFVFSGALTNDLDLLATPNGIGVSSAGTAVLTPTAGVELLIGSDVTVNSGATLFVYSGGSATGTTVRGGTLNLSGAAADTTLAGGATLDLVTSGATLTGALDFSGGNNDLVVSAVATNGAGDQAVISGMGITDTIDIAAISAAGASLGFSTSNGNEVITVSGTSGGSAVSESFVFSGTTTYDSATMGLGSDGSGGAELVITAGVTTVSSSTASGAYTVSSGQALKVVAGGSVSAVTVQSGGDLIVNGGLDAGAVIQSGGDETVYSGSAAQDQVSGSATVVSGGHVAGETVANGGSLVISGGVDSAATVASGGSENVAAGSASGDQIFGALSVSGATISGETIETGGSATLGSGAVDAGMTISAGGQLLVDAGATGSASLSKDLIYGSVATVSGHAATYTSETVESGGLLFLQNSNNATATTVLGGGELVLSGKETATNTTLSGGALLEIQSPKASLAGSLTFVGGGNTLEFTDISSATYGDNAVISGFTATDKIEIASTAYAYSALSLSESAGAGGDTVATITSGGVAVETISFAGSSLLNDLSLVSDNQGGSILEITPLPTTAYVSSITSSGAYSLTLNQTLQVDSGGAVTAAAVGSGAILVVNGGVDSGAAILSGGLETVSTGSGSGDQIYGSVVVSGGSVSDETVLSGGVLTVDPGTASNTLLDGGARLDLTGAAAALSGSLTFANGDNTLLVNALSNPGAGDQAVISGFSSSDKIDISGISSSGASISYAAGANNTEIVTVSGSTGSESFIFDDQSLYGPGAMALMPDSGSGVDMVLKTTPAVAFTSLNDLSTNQPTDLVNGTVNVAADPEAIGTTVSVFEGNAVVGAGTVGSDGYWSAKVAFQNDSGANVLTASDTDLAGQTGSAATSLTYNVNTAAAAFTAGNLVISVYGDGSGTGDYTLDQAAPITLDQITTSGALVSQTVLPETTTTVNGVTEYEISGEYGSASEGALQLSADGQSLTILGYGVNYQAFDASNGAAVYGNAALGQSNSIADASLMVVPRVVADINASGVIDTSTAITGIFDNNNPRSVATVDGTAFWLSGQGGSGSANQGVFYATDGSTTATAINTATDTRIAEIYNGQLYVSADSTQGATNISDYGALPTSATTPVVLNAISNTVVLTAATENSANASAVATAGTNGLTVNLSPESFFFANATTLYVADSGLPKNGGIGDGGLQKWIENPNTGIWTLEYTISVGNLVANTSAAGVSGLYGLTGQVNGDSVQLYATSSTINELDTSYLYSITDSLSATTDADASATTVMTAATDTIIRGVSFAPTPACYCAGTRILTERGEVAVEKLAVGDRVVTAHGECREIVWIGSRKLDIGKHAFPLEIQPVRVRAGAFGHGLPHRDLWLSPEHAVFVDGVLIPIIRLANGANVAQIAVERVSYFHIELESHDVLLAEGLPAESFLDCGSRSGFSNFEGFVELHPTFKPLSWDDACAPLRESGAEVAAVRRRLLAQAETLGFHLSNDPALHIRADGRTVWPQRDGDGDLVFALPENARDIWLVSRTWRPADEVSVEEGDKRHLGVSVKRLEIDGESCDLGALARGWHPLEGEAQNQWRWTNGAANLPTGAQHVVVRLTGKPHYWVEAETKAGEKGQTAA